MVASVTVMTTDVVGTMAVVVAMITEATIAVMIVAAAVVAIVGVIATVTMTMIDAAMAADVVNAMMAMARLLASTDTNLDVVTTTTALVNAVVVAVAVAVTSIDQVVKIAAMIQLLVANLVVNPVAKAHLERRMLEAENTAEKTDTASAKRSMISNGQGVLMFCITRSRQLLSYLTIVSLTDSGRNGKLLEDEHIRPRSTINRVSRVQKIASYGRRPMINFL